MMLNTGIVTMNETDYHSVLRRLNLEMTENS